MSGHIEFWLFLGPLFSRCFYPTRYFVNFGPTPFFQLFETLSWPKMRPKILNFYPRNFGHFWAALSKMSCRLRHHTISIVSCVFLHKKGYFELYARTPHCILPHTHFFPCLNPIFKNGLFLSVVAHVSMTFSDSNPHPSAEKRSNWQPLNFPNVKNDAGQKQYILRRRCRPKAGDAFTRTRLMPTFGGSAVFLLNIMAGNVQQKGRLKVQRCVFRVFRVFRVFGVFGVFRDYGLGCLLCLGCLGCPGVWGV